MKFWRWLRWRSLPLLDEILLTDDLESFRLLKEGKWYNGRFENSVRVDNPTHGVGQKHGHLLGRKGQEYGVVNVDGTGSHGYSDFRIHDKDAAVLRDLGFPIPEDGIIEWVALAETPRLLIV